MTFQVVLQNVSSALFDDAEPVGCCEVGHAVLFLRRLYVKGRCVTESCIDIFSFSLVREGTIRRLFWPPVLCPKFG